MATRKVSLNLSDRALKDLLEIKDVTGDPTLADVIRNAVAFYKFAHDKQQQGYVLVFERKADRLFLVGTRKSPWYKRMF